MTHEAFFPRFAWIILLTVIACFGAKAIFDTDDLPPITPLHHLHAISMLGWFVLFAVQPTLIQRGHYRAHRLLGRLSPLLVLVFLTLAIQISLLNWQRMGFALIPTANGVNLILFGSLYLAAIYWRRDSATHKRLMLYATLAMMGPAFGRIPEIFDATPVLAVVPLLAYQIAPLVHDRRAHGRVHPASWVGFALMLAAIPVILGLGGSESWTTTLEGLLGPRGGQAH
jgi:hypothetical protein